MKMTRGIAVAAFAALLATSTPTFAIEALQIAVQCPDVVLSWPSVEGETYIVQCRQTLDTNSVWFTLTNALPAETGTNWTCFVHSNQVVCSTNAGSGGGGGTSPPAPMSSSSGQPTLELADTAFPLAETTVQLLARSKVFPPYVWDLQGRAPHPWELENRPPLPWEPGAIRTPANRASSATTLLAASESEEGENGPLDSGGDTNEVAMGFYRVVRSGPHLFGLTNGTVLQGKVTLPVELGYADDMVLDEIAAFSRTELLAEAKVEVGADGRIRLNWDTSFVPNGDYTIHLEADFQFAGSLPGDEATVTVSNLIGFASCMGVFGDQLWMYADVALPQYDYEIKLYGDGGTYLGSFCDTNQSGPISFLWNLTAGGQTLPDTNFTAQFYLSTPGSGVVTVTNPPPTFHFWKESPWTIGNRFAVAWSESEGGFYAWRMEALMQEVVNMLSGVYLLSPGNVYQGGTFRLDGSTRTNFVVQTLMDPVYRHLYFNGHSNLKKMGYFGDSNSLISVDELRYALGNILEQNPSTNRMCQHPYRFVFMDSCNAGAGTWCEAFGIYQMPLSVGFFQNGIKTHARAFLGFTETVPRVNNKYLDYGYMISMFYDDWIKGVPLNQCVENAKAQTGYPMPAPTIIHGAQDLRRGSF